ncbi:hypothetical protein IGK74_000563 [Enterococcus sp. AZ150]|uniref:hypothetical protein n=1 Tax=Enterococcus sp. AZ150 TaxID=2774866 RepID=UPI003F1E49A1
MTIKKRYIVTAIIIIPVLISLLVHQEYKKKWLDGTWETKRQFKERKINIEVINSKRLHFTGNRGTDLFVYSYRKNSKPYYFFKDKEHNIYKIEKISNTTFRFYTTNENMRRYQGVVFDKVEE